MTKETPFTSSRRSVLKKSAIGIMGSMTLASSASASNGKGKGSDEKDKGNDYGNGNGIGAFLNEEAKWNDNPWSSGITNKTGESTIEIAVGAITTVNIPFTPPEEDQGPFSFDPQAVKISPGTEVTWNWIAAHHSVTSYNENADDPDDPHTTGDHGQLFDSHGSADDDHAFTYTFEEPGTYLYFCHPHGTPYPAYDPFLEQVPDVDPVQENLFGMRGAILVKGK